MIGDKKIQAFLLAYKELCHKHGVCVISEGEQVEAETKEDVGDWMWGSLWGIERSTWDNRKRRNA